MTSEGTLLPPGAELRARADAQALLKVAAVMAGASRERSAALGPMMLRIEAVRASESAVAHLRVSADTGEMQISTAVEQVEVLEPGSVAVVLPEFLAKLKAAESGKVELSVLDAEKIMLRTTRTRWEVSGTVGHWAMDEEQFEKTVQIKAEDLARAVAGVLPAVPKNSGRPSLERVHISKNWAKATNGALLLKRHLPGELFEADLSRPVAAIVATLKTGPVLISTSKKKTRLVYDRIEILLSRPLLPYPDVTKVETAAVVETHGLLVAEADLLLASLARVRTYSDNDHPEVSLRSVQTPQGWSVIMYAEDRSGNLTKEALLASWQDEKRLQATFHFAHLTAMLKAAGKGEVELRISTSGKSILIDDANRGLLAIAQQIVRN